MPLFTVTADRLHLRETSFGLMRGVGLKADPNFQALVLVIAVCCALFFIRSGLRRTIVVLVLFSGIIATFSRMGFIAALGCLLLSQYTRAREGSGNYSVALRRTAKLIALTALVGVISYAAAPASVRELVRHRIDQIANVEAIGNIHGLVGKRGLDSTSERALVAYGALWIIREHPVFGVGPGNTTKAMLSTVGVAKVAHNTFLEWLLTGGAFSIPAILLYLGVLSRAWRFDTVGQRAFLQSLNLTFLFMLLFLSVTTTLYWIPLVITEYLARRTAVRPQERWPAEYQGT
jgi:hypothetical protein